MERPRDKHLDQRELDALAPSSPLSGEPEYVLSPDALRNAERHVRSCEDCSSKLAKYREILDRLSDMAISEVASTRADCPKEDEVDWHEVASGLWPEFKARQLILHAATCDHCGPRLRAATNVSDLPTPEEETFLAALKSPSRPQPQPKRSSPDLEPLPLWGRVLGWKLMVPAMALMLFVGVLIAGKVSSSGPLSGSKFAEFAVATHRQHADGQLALDVHADSQQAVNEWLNAKSPFTIALPATPAMPGDERPYRVNGASLVRVGTKTAAFIAYQMQSGTVSLLVTPDSVASATGGVAVNFKKVSFHYRTVEGYKVVTWSAHGLTYALVSQEGNRTQSSCMVCHSAMRDRDLSHTPTPLTDKSDAVTSVWQ